MDEPVTPADPDDDTDAQQLARIEQVRADARRARARATERQETVAFVRELGFGDLLDD